MMEALQSIIGDQLNNRELATAFWLLLVFLVWLLRSQRARQLLRNLLKTVLERKILAIFLLMGVYVSLVASSLNRVGLWDPNKHAKDTLVWTVTVALVMVINVSNVSRQAGFFRKVVGDSLKLAVVLTVVLEFIIGFYPFSLPVELVLVPFLALVGGSLAIAEMKEYLSAKRVLQWIVALAGVAFLSHSVRSLLANADAFVSFERLIELLLPSILTLLLLPFIYILALFLRYESVFLRLNSQNRDSKLIRYAKRRILLRFGFNLSKLIKWSSQNLNLKASSKKQVFELVERPIKSASSRHGLTRRSVHRYRQPAEPLMDKVRATVDQIELADSSSRKFAANELRTLQNKVDQIQHRDEFPLKHETLEFAIKHALDALKHAANDDFVAANQALNKARLNQKRFDDWNVDLD